LGRRVRQDPWPSTRQVLYSSDREIHRSGRDTTARGHSEIRDGCPPGRTIHLRVEAAGESTITRIIRFVDGDEHGSSQELLNIDADGAPLGPASTARSAWLEFQAHASFPSDRTTITSEQLETPVGSLICLRYTVSDNNTVDTFWFAERLPGMPVVFTKHGDGELVNRVTMINNEVETFPDDVDQPR
jgi:hypothetical protein